MAQRGIRGKGDRGRRESAMGQGKKKKTRDDAGRGEKYYDHAIVRKREALEGESAAVGGHGGLGDLRKSTKTRIAGLDRAVHLEKKDKKKG